MPNTREKLIELLRKVQYQGNAVHGFHDKYIQNSELADHLIANNVVSVVRCKDCKFWADGLPGCTEHVKCCKVGFYMVMENGYCVFGERRGGD